MSIHKLVREGRERLGLTEEAFAKLCGVTRGTVQQWEREGGTAPARKRQKTVADVLGISVAQLMTGNGVANTSPGPDLRGEVPLISSVQAGVFTEHVDNFHPGDGGLEMIPTSVPINRHTFALRVEGDSMEPEFTEGMILIIEPELDPLPGDYVIAKNGGDETTFKQLVKDGADWYLKPLNSRYPIKPLEGSRVIGVLRATEKKYR